MYAQRVHQAIEVASRGLIAREHVIELLVLSAVASEHALIIGPPGTGKSAAARRMAQAFGGQYFEYLLGRFTEPSEIYGSIDFKSLREGRVETETQGMLPESEIVFLDEVFLGSTAILNTLLGILNERRFTRGHTRVTCPLKICIGASNSLPEDETLSAFADRFMVRIFVEGVQESRLEELLEIGRSLPNKLSAISTIQDLDVLNQSAQQVDLSNIRGYLAQAIIQLRAAGVHISDRRAVKAQNLIAAAAVLDGRHIASDADLWPLIYVAPTQSQQDTAKEILNKLLENSKNKALAAAAMKASASKEARAELLLREAQRVYADRAQIEEKKIWKHRLQALLRDIDSGFAVETSPEPIVALRNQLIEDIGEQ